MYKLSYKEDLEKFETKLNKITPVQWAYLAGILDGEGSIGLYHNRGKSGTSINTRITLIVNTDLRLIDYISDLIGYEFKYKANKLNVWSIYIQHRAFAEAFLLRIIPYLVGKKDRAINAMSFIQLRKGRFHHKYSEAELLLVDLSKKGNAKMGFASI